MKNLIRLLSFSTAALLLLVTPAGAPAYFGTLLSVPAGVTAVGSLPTFAIQNQTGSSITSQHYLTFGQGFSQGSVPSGSGLSINITGVGAVPTQLDCKVSWVADNSCKHGLITIQAPTMASSSTPVTGTISLAAGGGTPVDISTACSAGPWSETVTINELSPNNGSNFTENICTLLSNALASKTTETGSISGTTLTVSGVTGTIAIGHWVTGNQVPMGIKIIGGSGTTWTLQAPVASIITGDTHSNSVIDNIKINGNPVDPRLLGWQSGFSIVGTGVNTTVASISATQITLASGASSTNTGVSLTPGIPSEAMSTASYDTWLSGPKATEIRFDQPIDGNAHMQVDLRLHADNSVRTDVQILNDWANGTSNFGFMYNESIVQNGTTVVNLQGQTCTGSITSGTTSLTTSCTLQYYEGIEKTAVFPAFSNIDGHNSAPTSPYTVSLAATGTLTSGTFHTAGVTQYMYHSRHNVIWSNGDPPHNIIRDVKKFQDVGLLPDLDLGIGGNIGSYLSNIPAYLAGTGSNCNLPLPHNCFSEDNFGAGGGDPPFGWLGMVGTVQTIWMATQDKNAELGALKASDVGAAMPMHQYDQTKGYWLNVYDNPSMYWVNCGSLSPMVTCMDGSQVFSPWYMNGDFPISHEPDMSYVAYLFSGDRFRLDMMQAQANFSLSYMYQPPRTNANLSLSDISLNGDTEEREQAWVFKQGVYAAIASPIGSVPQRFGQTTTVDTLAWIYGYSIGTKTALSAAFGINTSTGGDETYGRLPQVTGACGLAGSWGANWQHSYTEHAVAFAAKNGFANAANFLNFLGHWSSNDGLPHSGWDPYNFAAYYTPTFDGTGFLHTWAAVQTRAACDPNSFMSGPGAFSSGGVSWIGRNFAEVSLSGLANVISYTTDPIILHNAMQVYPWMLAQNNSAAGLGYAAQYTAQGGGPGGFLNDPTWSTKPTLPDGSRIYFQQIKTDASNTNVTLTSSGGTSILATWGTGTDTLVGGTGGDLLYSGSTGNNTITAGTGNQFLYGPLHTAGYACTGTNLFRDNTGNNFMRGSTVCGANTFEFGGQTLNNSGVDTLENFRPGTDKLKIKTNLDGSGVTTAAGFLALGSTVSGSCVFNIGGSNSITTTGVPCASISAGDITIF